jgi:dimethylglycine dehydrogenase
MKENGTWDVHTPQGVINAKKVVNASGFWAKDVGELTGMPLPLVAMQHQYLVTKSVPEVQALKKEFPVLRHLEGSFYLRQERDGLLVGPYESFETNVACEDWANGKVPHGFGKELFEPDLDRLQPHLEAAMQMMPCFQTAEIQTVVNGPIT